MISKLNIFSSFEKADLVWGKCKTQQCFMYSGKWILQGFIFISLNDVYPISHEYLSSYSIGKDVTTITVDTLYCGKRWQDWIRHETNVKRLTKGGCWETFVYEMDG